MPLLKLMWRVIWRREHYPGSRLNASVSTGTCAQISFLAILPRYKSRVSCGGMPALVFYHRQCILSKQTKSSLNASYILYRCLPPIPGTSSIFDIIFRWILCTNSTLLAKNSNLPSQIKLARREKAGQRFKIIDTATLLMPVSAAHQDKLVIS